MSGIPSWARVGAKVVFIGGPPERWPAARGYKAQGLPELRRVYTIRDTKACSEAHVRLIETRVSGHGPDGRPYTDAWLNVRAFRPLVTRSQESDVALFTHLLTPERTDA